MRILLDTHVFLWGLLTPDRLSARAASILESAENSLYFSAASTWEIAIKWSKGSLKLPAPPQDFIVGRLIEIGVFLLPISVSESLGTAALPFRHKDPFDRLLISQARANKLRLFSNDPIFKKYDVDVFWV